MTRSDPGPPCHLPGLDVDAGGELHRGRTAAGRPFETPRLTRRRAARVAAEVRAAALRARRERATDRVVETAARAAGRLADPGDPGGAGARCLLSRELGWPRELVEETLEGMADVWSGEALRAVLEEELGGTAVLDGYEPAGRVSAAGVPAPPGEGRPRRRRAAGPPLLLVIVAGNVPGVGVTAALRGLVARSGVLMKAPEGEPGLVPHFARLLGEEDPLLGDSLAATWWPGSSGAEVGEVWLERAGMVVVYGEEEAVRGVRRAAPVETEVLVYGPKLGVGLVLPDAADGGGSWPSRLARDVCAYEQQGCVSPRTVYVLGDDPLPFARALSGAMEEEVTRIPRPGPGAAEAVALRSLRAEEEFRSYARERDARRGPSAAGGDEGGRTSLSGDDGAGWTILPGPAAPPASTGLPRVVRVHAVPAIGRLGELLAPMEGRIQAFGYAGRKGRRRVAEMAAGLGVARVAPFGTVAWPPADWRHDGRHQILPLLRWTDWESGPG